MKVLHISFFGPVNSGKSTLVNAIAGQEVSLVSAVPGTTTDPVRKRIELPGLGPCVLIDTAGLGDGSMLGAERERRTRTILDETDIAVLVLVASQTMGRQPQKGGINEGNVPESGTLTALIEKAGIPTVIYTRGESVESLLERIAAAMPKEEDKYLTGNLVKTGDTVVLVMPQDSEAPKGRLILPQVQLIRELLDRGCNPLCCTPEMLSTALGSLKAAPALVITDSQVFAAVNATLPAEVPLTSFSILLAGAKGDLNVFVEGAKAIDTLKMGDRVLIAEACTHVPDTEDIGRVKIPALLRKKMADQVGHDVPSAVVGHDVPSDTVGHDVTPDAIGGLYVDIAAGNDFPEDLTPYALIIHCGACVATATLVRSRIKKALLAGVPITNYGIALAKLQGILDRVSLQTQRRSF